MIIDRGTVVADGTAAELTGGRSLEERFRELTTAEGEPQDGDPAPEGKASRRRARRKLRS